MEWLSIVRTSNTDNLKIDKIIPLLMKVILTYHQTQLHSNR